MKNLFIIVILMLGVSMFGQDNSIAFLAGHAEITYTGSWDDGELISVEGQDIVLSMMDPDSDYHLTITNKYGDKFKTYGEELSYITIDGHKCSCYHYRATDQSGTECEVLVRYFEDDTKWGEMYRYSFRVFYNNVWYGYYANMYDPDAPSELGEKPKSPPVGSKAL